jgi:OmpA-OmpF porin, OOP family
MSGMTKVLVLPLCAAAAIAVAPASAQTRSGTSYVPYTTNGYVGLNVGRPEYKLGCTAGFSCDDPNVSYHLYTGGSFNEWLGVELGYLYMGKADRQGGTTRGHGLNLSAVGSVPFGQSFKGFGKVGTTWGRTTVSAAAGSGEVVGDESGFGLSYGLGVGWDLNAATQLVAGWDRHNMKFAGRGREPVEAVSIGAKFRF